jgi:hypothetical protein
MVSEAFASVLRSGRAEFNKRFAEGRRLYPELNGAAFSEFLERTADTLVLAISKVAPDRVAEVAMAVYDVGLELVGQKLAGPGARHEIIEEGWRRVLVPGASIISTAPERCIRSISNALHHLASTPGAQPDQWIATLEKYGPQCGTPDALLSLGQLAAWKAGLAHFRQGAIAAADAIPSSIVLAALGAPPSNDWTDIRKKLMADPWFDPVTLTAEGNDQNSTLRVMAQVGGFRGFGGFFLEPPEIASDGEHFLVRSGEECWLLTADLFGATFHRASVPEFEVAHQNVKLPPGLQISDSKLLWGGQRFEIPSLGRFTSAAANATTLALTSELTHSVILLALK